MAEELESKQRPSRLWYLLPLFLGLLGGVIGYFLLKDRNRKFAERILLAGVIVLVAWIAFLFLSIILAFWAIEFSKAPSGLTEQVETQIKSVFQK
jgi:H+/Cl- antiporter ClcA